MKKSFAGSIILVAILFLINTSHASLMKSFAIVNKTGFTVTSVKLSHSGSESWGVNITTLDQIVDGESFKFMMSIEQPNCVFDIKYTDSSGKEYTMRQVDFCNSEMISLIVPPVQNTKSNDGNTGTNPQKKLENK